MIDWNEVVLVTSNNGDSHLAQKCTKNKEFPGYIRKMCDGQWVSERKISSGTNITCSVCKLRV